MDEHCKLAIDRLASFSNRIMPYLVNHPPDSFNYYSSAHAYIIWYSIFAVVFLQAWESDSPTRTHVVTFFPKCPNCNCSYFGLVWLEQSRMNPFLIIGWAVQQSTGNVHVLLAALLQRHQEDHQSLPRDHGRESAGRGTRLLRVRHQIQK